MKSGTELQEAFVEAFVANGGNSAKAARQAGYSVKSARQIGGRLSRNPAIQKLIHAEQQRLIGGNLCSKALGVLERILDDPSAPYGARVDACRLVLDRGGHAAGRAVEPQHTQDKPMNELSIEELEEIIRGTRAQLNLQNKTIDGVATLVN